MASIGMPACPATEGFCQMRMRLGRPVRPPPGLEDVVPEWCDPGRSQRVADDSASCCSTMADSHDLATFAAHCRGQPARPVIALASALGSITGQMSPGPFLASPGVTSGKGSSVNQQSSPGLMLASLARPPPGLEDVVPRCHAAQGMVDDFTSCCSTMADSHDVASFAASLRGEPRRPAVALAGSLGSGASHMPSLGSAGHHLGLCKPCDFLHRSSEGCKAGEKCKFCHLCGPDENKKRKMAKKELLRTMRQWQQLGAASSPAAPGL